MRKLLIVILFISLSTPVFSCANAYLFKVFPIGMCGDTIVSIDIRIQPTSNVVLLEDSPFPNSIDLKIKPKGDVMWFIHSYITKYDEHQNPLEITCVDSVSFEKWDCKEELKIMYEKAYDKVISDNKEVRLFNTESITFCDFEEQCENVKIKGKTFIYKKKKYKTPIIKDSTYYGFLGSEYLIDYLSAISSVRKYTLGSMELIVVNTQVGQKLVEQNKPDVKFDHVSNAIYMEPLLYHANGIDYFFIRRKTI